MLKICPCIPNVNYVPLAHVGAHIGACVGHFMLALGIIGLHWALLARVGLYWLALGGLHWVRKFFYTNMLVSVM